MPADALNERTCRQGVFKSANPQKRGLLDCGTEARSGNGSHNGLRVERPLDRCRATCQVDRDCCHAINAFHCLFHACLAMRALHSFYFKFHFAVILRCYCYSSFTAHTSHRHHSLANLRRRLLSTTLTLLKAIKALPSAGVICTLATGAKTPAAKGMHTTL